VLLARFPNDLKEGDLEQVALATRGYVGADISAIVRDAGTAAIRRQLHNNQDRPILELPDLMACLKTIRPSALREHFVETPEVRWADVGGQAYVKEKLKETVEWPLMYPETFLRLGVRPPKGVLLYGPPGCSKTLIARALATEGGVNFISVKGPEVMKTFDIWKTN
jgi:AAA family ATPase